MEVIGYSKEYKEESSIGKHSALFPETIFYVIAEATGCGKTMLLINLLRREHTLNFRDFYIYCPTIHQDAYTNLKDHFEMEEKGIKINYKKGMGKNKIITIANFLSPDDTIIASESLIQMLIILW